jgi:predicted RNA-binding Zn-ribbon protein involved in translation (DUF1610 family)
MKKLSCSNCGYETENTSIENFACPICGNVLLDKKGIDIGHCKEIKDFLPKFAEIKMKDNIKKYGNARIWRAIEGITLPSRLQYRKIFFKVGGVVPKTEI